MWRAGRLNIHSARHMLLLLHLSASGIPVAAACAEAAICTDKSLINAHKQQSDPHPHPMEHAHTAIHPFSLCGPALNQILKGGVGGGGWIIPHTESCIPQISLGFTLSDCNPTINQHQSTPHRYWHTLRPAVWMITQLDGGWGLKPESRCLAWGCPLWVGMRSYFQSDSEWFALLWFYYFGLEKKIMWLISDARMTRRITCLHHVRYITCIFDTNIFQKGRRQQWMWEFTRFILQRVFIYGDLLTSCMFVVCTTLFYVFVHKVYTDMNYGLWGLSDKSS